MQIKLKTLKILLTMGAIFVLFTAMMPGALSDQSYGGMGWSKSHKGIKSIDMVKTVTDVTDGNIMFQIPSIAVTGKEGKVYTMTFPTPPTGAYSLKYGAGYVSMQGVNSADVAVRPMNNATLGIADTSMVVSMKDIKVLMDDRDTFVFEYGKIGIMLPDGTAKVYSLDKPVRMTFSKDRKIMMIDAYPSYGDILSYAYTNMAKFPADAQPLSIQDMRNAESLGRIQSIGTAPILRPAATATPTATATPSPTVTPTATPIATPVVTPTATPIVTPTATPVVSPVPTVEPTVEPTVIPIVSPTPVTAPVPAL